MYNIFRSANGITMTSLCLIHKSITKERKFTEHDYHEYRPRIVLFPEYVYFVQICPVFAGPVWLRTIRNTKYGIRNVQTDKKSTVLEKYYDRTKPVPPTTYNRTLHSIPT